ncbi:ergothioneine biosynthesis protein EgtC [Spirulina sp. CS-785/01]|uniref:ergothioneine biosynthesis protein EgtC n=1 Tax=Spirulina sp. CS-785/01 TaxID=3021716 RepID=UPI0023306F4B|nr:ergothioneine biosynthesis protein EgtC [Spirulina sp. CS-785/01]MDB9312760.1 ergothioneine biosynthesis protein EgtC [Spirulina sp. CS-785/01]
MTKPKHSLLVQSYAPQEMKVALMNADGFGVGWYHAQRQELPYTYKNILPMWSDINLSPLSRYIESDCMLGYVRSATPGLAVELSNCQPFTQGQLMFTHNGYIEHFRQTLRRPLRQLLSAQAEEWIQGTTDSEYFCALVLTYLEETPEQGVEGALRRALQTLGEMAQSPFVKFAATLVISTGDRLIGCRYANFDNIPSLYLSCQSPDYPEAVILASEPLFGGDWKHCPAQSIISVGKDCEVHIQRI